MIRKERKVAIGLPVFNGGSLLTETLVSLLAQSFEDFELIITDNASTDGTECICRDFAARDPRIRYHRNDKNFGLAGNFNRAFEMAEAEYFKWAAADDLCHPEYLMRCVHALDRESDVVLAYTKTTFINEAGTPLDIHDPGWNLDSDLPRERMRQVIYREGSWVNAILGLIRTTALRRTRLLPSYPGGDYRLLGELSLLGKFIEVPDFLYRRRLHPRSSSQNTRNIQWMVNYHKGEGERICLPSWNLGADHFLTIVRSGLRNREKLSLLKSLLHRMNWNRRFLAEELGAAARLITGKTPPASRE